MWTKHQEKAQEESLQKHQEIGFRSWCKLWSDATCDQKGSKTIPLQENKSPVTDTAAKTKKLQRTKLLLKKLRDGTQPPILWTDEKLFTVYDVHNHQNDRIGAANKQDIPLNSRLMFQRQKPASAIVWAGVASTGEKTFLFLIEEGVKVNQHVYLELLRDKLVLRVDTAFGESGITLHQDRATSHTTNLYLYLFYS